LTILGLHASQNENNIVKDKKQVSDFYYLRLIKGKQSHTNRERKKYDLIVHPKTSNYDVLAKLQFLNFLDFKRYDVKETEWTSHVGMIWEWPFKSSLTSRVDFTNMFTCRLYAQRSKKRKKDSQVNSVFFTFTICTRKNCSKNVGEIDPRWKALKGKLQLIVSTLSIIIILWAHMFFLILLTTARILQKWIRIFL